MTSNRMVILTLLIVSLFFISPAFACYFPGPSGSSVKVTVYASDGKTPLPGAQVTLIVYNGSKVLTSVGPESTDDNGQFTFPNDGGASETGLSYKVHATYYGDEIHVNCEGTEHSADSAPFTLGGSEKDIYITIPGVTVVHGGDSGSSPEPTACPTNNPNPTSCPTNPKGNHSPYPPMVAGEKPGIILGVVLSNDSSDPIHNAYVAIVSADNPSIEYSAVKTDKNGFFEFFGVNSTNGSKAYKIYITDGKGKTAYSNAFSVGSAQTVQINLGLGGNDVAVEIPLNPTLINNSTTCPASNLTAALNNSSVKLDLPKEKSKDVLSQVSDFFGSVILGIFHL